MFKTAFEEGQKTNASLGKPAADDEAKKEQEGNPKEDAHTDAAKDDGAEEDKEDKTG